MRATSQALEHDWERRIGRDRLTEFRGTLTVLLT